MQDFNLEEVATKYPSTHRSNLQCIQQLLANLGSPHLFIPPVIHIAGTNGKGSTQAFLRSIFEQKGLKVHAFTSPHLKRFNERIVIAGQEIENTMAYALLHECEQHIQNDGVPTWFELVTTMAFLAFARHPADILLLETGVGGRLDATNVIPNPLVTAINSISYDHQSHLGNSLKEIAFAKAGIFKKGTAIFSVKQPEEVERVLIQESKELQAPLFIEGHHWTINKSSQGLVYNSKVPYPQISLKGTYQLQNAGLALSIASFLKHHFKFNNMHLKKGIESAIWPGRLQDISHSSLNSYLRPGSELWLDGAHNEGGAQALVSSLKEFNQSPTYFIIGMLQHKEHLNFLKPLSTYAEALFFIPILSSTKSILPDYLASLIKDKKCYTAYSLIESLEKINTVSSTPARVVICGSLYLVGDILKTIDE